MARKKKYNETTVVEKAMSLFWGNGYETTSTRMLEKEMGINQFSIYASFGNKEGLFIECIKLYKQKIRLITNILENSLVPVEGIKQYFYDFIDFSKANEIQRGCLITNTIHEFGTEKETVITNDAISFTKYIRSLFYNNLKLDKTKNENTLNQQADFLIVSIASLSVSSKIFSKELMNTYIEQTFIKI